MVTYMSEDIIKCRRCKKTVIIEEYPAHLCSPIPNGKTVNIDIDYFIVSKNQNDETLLFVKDLEGTTYRLTLKEKNELFDYSPTEFQQRNKTPDDETEPNFVINT